MTRPHRRGVAVRGLLAACLIVVASGCARSEVDRSAGPVGAVGPASVAATDAGGPPVATVIPTAPPVRNVSAATPLSPSDPVRVDIPRLGVTSDLMRLGLESDGSLQVPPGAYPAGWYTGSPTPGAIGPAILASHVDWNGQAGAFSRIGQLGAGDEVDVTRADGRTVRFAIDQVDRYPKDRFPTEAVYGNIDHAGLRLITCGGVFDSSAHSYQDNTVVYATLVGSTP